MITEIINIAAESTKAIAYNSTRQANFGVAPLVQVWQQRDEGKYYLTDVQPVIDAAPPALSMLSFDFGGAVTGFIVIK